jgi:hypothetical protein
VILARTAGFYLAVLAYFKPLCIGFVGFLSHTQSRILHESPPCVKRALVVRDG